MELFHQSFPGRHRHRAIMGLHCARRCHSDQAIDQLNFSQGEMAMFATFLSWQCDAMGRPLLGPS